MRPTLIAVGILLVVMPARGAPRKPRASGIRLWEPDLGGDLRSASSRYGWQD